MSSASAYLAFYIASSSKNLGHRLIAGLDGGSHSHVEVAIKDSEYSDSYTCLSSTCKTGVRTRQAKLNPNNWLVIPIEDDPVTIQSRFIPLKGAKYDWFGLITTHISYFPQGKYRYNCVELAATVLGLNDAETWGIEELLEHYLK